MRQHARFITAPPADHRRAAFDVSNDSAWSIIASGAGATAPPNLLIIIIFSGSDLKGSTGASGAGLMVLLRRNEEVPGRALSASHAASIV
jgi:hypothetical protein